MDRINLCQISSGTGTARRTDEQQTFYDIMPRVLFYTSASNFIGQFEPRHLQFVKEVVVPAFLRLRRRWPEAYRLLVRKSVFDFQIRICEYKDNRFQEKDMAIAGTTECRYPDKATIFINASVGDSSYLSNILYHENMHAVSHLAVKDKPNKFYIPKFMNINNLSLYINEKNKKILTRLYKDYEKRRAEEEKEATAFAQRLEVFLLSQAGSISKEEAHEMLYNGYIKIKNKHNCWAYHTLDKKHFGDDDFVLKYFMHNELVIYCEEELLIYGLLFYFGPEEEKQRLKAQEPELYELIEKEVIPLVKKASIKADK